jgi:hypothetical protein
VSSGMPRRCLRSMPLFVAWIAGLVVAITLLGPASSAAAPGETEGTETTEQFTALTYNVAGLPVGLSGSEPNINTP